MAYCNTKEQSESVPVIILRNGSFLKYQHRMLLSFEQYDKSKNHKSKRSYPLKAFTKMAEAATMPIGELFKCFGSLYLDLKITSHFSKKTLSKGDCSICRNQQHIRVQS